MSTRWLGISMFVLGFSAPAAAFHTVFDFTVDRFEADGNQHGAADGVPDFIDDFDDPGLSNWYTPYGTSSVSGGRLHVQSPGTHLPGPDGLALDLTEVASHTSVHRGFGNFTATAVFDPVVPPEQHFYHFTLYTYGSSSYFNELFGVDIHTANGVTLVEQHLIELDISHGIYQTVQTEGQVVTAADITGQIHFRVAYDDAAGTIVSSFSLDGGTTFQSPFSPAPIMTQGRDYAQYILGADPRLSTATTSTTTTPVTTTTTTTTLPSLCARTLCNAAGKSRLDLRGKAKGQVLRWAWLEGEGVSAAELGNPLPGGETGYAVCLRDGTGASVYERYFAPGVPWKATKGGFRHAGGDVSLAVNSGAAGFSRVLLEMKRLQLSLALPLTVRVEAETGACWSSTYVPADVRTNRAQHLVAVQGTRLRLR